MQRRSTPPPPSAWRDWRLTAVRRDEADARAAVRRLRRQRADPAELRQAEIAAGLAIGRAADAEAALRKQ